jgi:FdhD protein
VAVTDEANPRRRYPSRVPKGRTATVLVRRFDGQGAARAPDEVAVEAPLEVRIDGRLVTVTMRTPGDDFELAAGLCVGEGLLRPGGAPVRIRACAHRASGSRIDVVTVDTGGTAPAPAARTTASTTSCGLCGSTAIAALMGRLRPRPQPARPFPPEVLLAVPERVRAAQGVFAATGGVHAAAAFGPAGDVRVIREDVGRHNAVDKVVGRLLFDGCLPAGDLGLFVSGRVSFEIVAKAWAAGFAAVLAVSAPSSLAVETARRGGLALYGFARPGRVNAYVEPGDGHA